MSKPFNILLIVWILVAAGCSSGTGRSSGQDETNPDSLADLFEEDPIVTNHVDTAAANEAAIIDSTDALVKERHSNYIYISKPKMRLYVLNKHDSVLFSCGIACGARKGDKQEKGDFRTPEGEFHICGIYNSTDWEHKTPDGRKVKGCYGPIFLSLATPGFSGIGIHGTNAPRSIGRRASEGCIRVKSSNIEIIKERYAFGGMQVVVSGENERLPFMNGDTKNDVLPLEDTAKVDSLISQSATDSLGTISPDTLCLHSDSLPRRVHELDS